MQKVHTIFSVFLLAVVSVLSTGCAGVDYRQATAQSAGAFVGTATGGLIASAPGCANLGAIGCQSVANAASAFTGSVAGQATYASMTPPPQQRTQQQGPSLGFSPDPNRNGCGWVMPNGVYVCPQNNATQSQASGSSFDCKVDGKITGKKVFAANGNDAVILCKQKS